MIVGRPSGAQAAIPGDPGFHLRLVCAVHPHHAAAATKAGNAELSCGGAIALGRPLERRVEVLECLVARQLICAFDDFVQVVPLPELADAAAGCAVRCSGGRVSSFVSRAIVVENHFLSAAAKSLSASAFASLFAFAS